MQLDNRHLELYKKLGDKKMSYEELLQFRTECPSSECVQCGIIICPHSEPLHYHHDGCPSCDDSDATGHLSDDEFMSLLSLQIERENWNTVALYNWFFVNRQDVPEPYEKERDIYVIGQILNQGAKSGRPDGRWVRTSRVEEYIEGIHIKTQSNTTYLLKYQADAITVDKLLDGTFGGDRGEAFDPELDKTP